MRIGEVAAQTGVNIQTIRFYERRGLLQKPRRTAAGYRDYPAETINVVRCIRGFQELGFTLQEIEDLQRDPLDAAALQSRLEAKQRVLDERIEALQRMRDKLQQIIAVAASGRRNLYSLCQISRDAPALT